MYDRVQHRGFGLSFGDSSFVVAGPGRVATAVNPRDARFVTTRSQSSLRHGKPFVFDTNPGDVLLVFTDGVDECNYRSPATSIQPHHLAQLVDLGNGDPLNTCNRIVAAALEGVDGHPGGEDNIALICATA